MGKYLWQCGVAVSTHSVMHAYARIGRMVLIYISRCLGDWEKRVPRVPRYLGTCVPGYLILWEPNFNKLDELISAFA